MLYTIITMLLTLKIAFLQIKYVLCVTTSFDHSHIVRHIASCWGPVLSVTEQRGMVNREESKMKPGTFIGAFLFNASRPYICIYIRISLF